MFTGNETGLSWRDAYSHTQEMEIDYQMSDCYFPPWTTCKRNEKYFTVVKNLYSSLILLILTTFQLSSRPLLQNILHRFRLSQWATTSCNMLILWLYCYCQFLACMLLFAIQARRQRTAAKRNSLLSFNKRTSGAKGKSRFSQMDKLNVDGRWWSFCSFFWLLRKIEERGRIDFVEIHSWEGSEICFGITMKKYFRATMLCRW